MKGLLFTYLLCYGGSLVALVRPWYGLLIYICFALLRPHALWPWSVPAGNYSRIIAIALLIGWAINGFGGLYMGRSKKVVGLLVGFLVWEAISTVLCANPDRAWMYLDIHFKVVLPFIVGITLVRTEKQVLQLAWVMMLCEAYLAFEVNQYYFQGNNVLERSGFLGRDNNGFALDLATATGLAFFCGLSTRNIFLKMIAFLGAAFMTHAILFSFSRGAMLGLCFVGFASFMVLPKRPSVLALFGLGIVLAMAMAGKEVREEFISVFASKEERDFSVESRTILWGACIGMMNDNPVLGVGPDHFKMNVHRYVSFESGKAAHMTWLHTGAELGYPGLILYLGFYLVAGWQAFRMALLFNKKKYPTQMKYIPHMVFASLVGYMVSASFMSVQLHEMSYYIVLLGCVSINVFFAGPHFEQGRGHENNIVPIAPKFR